ncbi:MAG: LruC domain-containing protein [Bacteroidota bacterium]
MKKLGLLLLAIGVLFAACNKDDDQVDMTPEKMEDINVSDDFDWKTTSETTVNLPQDRELDSSAIYIVDDERVYYKGPAIRDNYPVVIPSYADAGKLKVMDYNPFDPSTQDKKGNDSDGDGIKDNKDDFPNDPNKAFRNFYPASGYGTLAYEDLWPSKGDYDFNDMVLDYQFETVTDANDHVVEVNAEIVVRAAGAGYHNAFAFEFPFVDPDDVHNVTGYQVNDPVFNISANGTEANQSNLNVIVFDDIYDVLQHPGGGTGINVDPGMSSVQPETLMVSMEFMQNGQPAGGSPVSTWDLSIADFNPYLIANVSGEGRGREIHLPGQTPSDLADVSYFNTNDDDTDNSIYNSIQQAQNSKITGKSYETEDNYPWALSFYDSFDYMIEKNSIVKGYLKFYKWAENGSNSNWYKVDNSSFRDYQYIY